MSQTVRTVGVRTGRTSSAAWNRLGRAVLAFAVVGVCAGGCGDDDDDGGLSQAQQQGVGDACGRDADCIDTAPECLTNFKGGYCGIRDCVDDEDCPQGSACVAHDDGTNYCFLVCREKYECNYFRPVDFESNCSANVDFVEGARGNKACVPPS